MSEDVLLPDEKNSLIWINPGRMSGAPCFYQTRVPIDCLFVSLEGNVSLDEWLDAFPPVTREQAVAILEYAYNKMSQSFPGAGKGLEHFTNHNHGDN